MIKVVVIEGDGIGPEVVSSAVQVLNSLSLDIELIPAKMGLKCFHETGSYLPNETLSALDDSDACLFGAITSVPGDPCYRSPLLHLRKHLDLYANVRPAWRIHPNIGTSDLDLVIVRENTEGMYTGIEREVEGGIVAERMVSRRACERIVDYAISLARKQGRKRITCVHKANVMRMSDGLFRSVFFERAKHKEITTDEMFVDAAAAGLIVQPRRFDCIVTLNLYGDILSDEAAALMGGLGLAPSGNIGPDYGIFEPVHGSAPDIAGLGIANPIGTILSAAMMLEFLGMKEESDFIRSKLRSTIEQGNRTMDIGGNLGTQEFTERLLRQADTK